MMCHVTHTTFGGVDIERGGAAPWMEVVVCMVPPHAAAIAHEATCSTFEALLSSTLRTEVQETYQP